MDFLREEIRAPQDSTGTAIVATGVEFVSPRIKQNKSNVISPTRSVWDAYNKRKEIIEEPRIPFHEIMHGMQADGYIRGAVSKYVNSIFLRGYKLVTLKPDIERYMRVRLQMLTDTMADYNHIDDFFHAIAHDLVAYANVYVVKIRQKQKFIPKGMKINGVPRIKPKGKPDDKPVLEQQDPITSYELIHPAQMHLVRDDNGNVIRFEQWPMHERKRPNDAKNRREWEPDQVIHITIDREDGYAVGHPFLATVLDDVRMLRGIEDNASKLAYRFAFPFTQIKVGEMTPGFQATDEQLEFYRNLIAKAPPDASLVTAEMVEFNVIGVEGEAIQLSPYLEHFESRSFSGLGVSGVAMGKGDTSNKSTADAMTVSMHDSIKHFQNVLMRSLNKEIFRELLQEGGWEWYDNPDKNWLEMVFEEIEIENKIRVETHIKDLYQSNMITSAEMRQLMNRQPFTPSQWEDTFLVKVLLPQDIIKLTGTTDLDEHGELMLQKHKADMQDAKMAKDMHPKQLAAADVDLEGKKIGNQGLKLDNKLKQKELDTPADTAGANPAGAHQTTTVSTKKIPGGGSSKSVTVKKPVTAPKGHFSPVPGIAPGPAAAPKTTAKNTKNQQNPANQHGARTAPKRKTEGLYLSKGLYLSESLSSGSVDLTTKLKHYHSELSSMYEQLEAAAIQAGKDHLASGSQDEPKLAEMLFALQKSRILSLSQRYLHTSFHTGALTFNEQNKTTEQPRGLYTNEKKALIEFNEKTFERLIKDLCRPSLRAITRQQENQNPNPDKMAQKIHEIFEDCKYRLDLIANSEIPQAFWLGYASAAYNHGIPLQLKREEEECDVCDKHLGKLENSSSARQRLRSVPVYHPNCNCGLEIAAALVEPN